MKENITYMISDSTIKYFIPQSAQNLIIKNYCQNNNLTYRLPSTEVNLKSHYSVLKDIVEQQSLTNVTFYSLEALPWDDNILMNKIYELIKNQVNFHFALENLLVNKNNIHELKLIGIYDRK